jgi:hypothetical protein
MRALLLLLFIFSIFKADAQSFVNYRDTANQFSIDIPTGWKYGVNKSYPDIILLAYRTPTSKADSSRDNFNINTIKTPNKSLDKTFEDFMKYLPEAKGYKLIDTGATILNGLKFKWLVETHKNESNNMQMHNYDFVTIKNGITYILTLITFSYSFNTVKPMFDTIASSFALQN